MDYTTLSDDDKLLLARDRLRGLESDHFRLTIAEEPNSELRLAQLEEQAAATKKVVKELEKKTK